MNAKDEPRPVAPPEGQRGWDDAVGFHVIGESPGGLFRREHRFTEHGANTLVAQWKLEFADEDAGKILIYIRPLFDRPTTPTAPEPAGVVVSDAMVERALAATLLDDWGDTRTVEYRLCMYEKAARDVIRAALQAALRQPTEGEK